MGCQIGTMAKRYLADLCILLLLVDRLPTTDVLKRAHEEWTRIAPGQSWLCRNLQMSSTALDSHWAMVAEGV
jgi:type II secretory pathway component PulL